MQFKLDLRLARLLGIHTQTRPVIINALWQYIKTHRLQDPAEREYINCDKYLEQVPPLSRSVVSSYCGPSVGQRVRGWVVVGVRSTGFRTLLSTSISAVTSTSNRCLLAFCLLSFIF